MKTDISRYINKVTLLIIIVACSFNVSYAQKVGVVLSGGGAKGLYHIGILRALEENNIPIDNITGTSMGAIIGALYVSGMTIDEIEGIFLSDQVHAWLSGKIEMKYQNYYRVTDSDGSILSLDIDLKKILSNISDTPSSEESFDKDKQIKAVNFNLNNIENYYINTIIPSLQLDIALMDMFTAPSAAAKHNFDSLFVPFRCVSVDILERKEFLWRGGDLGRAVRSSMAIPFVFKPMIVDTMMMYDGGILNNFPWQANLDEFDSDILIGCICTTDTVDPSSITGQITMLTMNKTNYDIPDSIGVKIERAVDIGMLDFSRAKEIIDLGHRDAMLAMPELKRRISREVTPEEVTIKRRGFRGKLPAFAINEIEITGLNARQTKYVQDQLNFAEGAILSFEDFKREYFKIVEGGMIAGGFPTAAYNPETGYFKIYMSMTSRHNFKTMAGVNISSTNINAGYLGITYSRIGRNSTSYSLSGYLGNFYSAVEIASRQNFYSGKLPFYVNSTANYIFQDYGRGNNQRSSFANRSFDYSRFNGVYISSAIGAPVNQKAKFELRIAMGQDKYNYDSYNSTNPLTSYNQNRYNYTNINGSVSRNSLNYKSYATRGVKQSISIFATHGRDTYKPGFKELPSVSVPDITYTDDTESPETDQPELPETDGPWFPDTDNSTINSTVKDKSIWLGASIFREKYNYVTKHFSIGYSLEAVYTNIPDMSSSYALALISPGFYPTEHSSTLFIPEFHRRSYAAVGIKPIFEWNESIYLKNEFYLHYSDLNSYKDVIDKLRYVISSTLVYQSPIGPVSFNYSHYSIKNSRMSQNYWTFNMGFLIFKNRGIKYF